MLLGAPTAVCTLLLICARLAVAQPSAATPLSLARPSYPTIAVSALVTGDVEVLIHVSNDGRVISETAVSGPDLLRAAALEAAQRTTFACRECAHTVDYRIVYSFRFASAFKPIREEDQPPPDIRSSGQAHVTVLAEPPLAEIYFTDVRGRAAKCAYLWNCGWFWSGHDFYYHRVRAARCLWLWRCGYELDEFYQKYNRDHSPTSTN